MSSLLTIFRDGEVEDRDIEKTLPSPAAFSVNIFLTNQFIKIKDH